MYTYVCIWIYVSTYVTIMILALCASSGGMGFIHGSHMFCIALCVCGDVSCWCSSILFEKTKCKCVPQMGRIYVTQNDNKTITKTITKLTRKPSSNTMAHWSPCHGGSPQRGKPHPVISADSLQNDKEEKTIRWKRHKQIYTFFFFNHLTLIDV